jgi:hypothetical protein
VSSFAKCTIPWGVRVVSVSKEVLSLLSVYQQVLSAFDPVMVEYQGKPSKITKKDPHETVAHMQSVYQLVVLDQTFCIKVQFILRKLACDRKRTLMARVWAQELNHPRFTVSGVHVEQLLTEACQMDSIAFALSRFVVTDTKHKRKHNA